MRNYVDHHKSDMFKMQEWDNNLIVFITCAPNVSIGEYEYTYTYWCGYGILKDKRM